MTKLFDIMYIVKNGFNQLYSDLGHDEDREIFTSFLIECASERIAKEILESFA